MSFNESNTVEQMILDALSDATTGGNRPFELKDAPGWGASLGSDMAGAAAHPATWEYVSANDVPRQAGDVMVEPWLRLALIRLNPEIANQPDRADEVIYALRAIILSVQADGLVRANENFMDWLRGEKTMPFGPNGEHVPVRLVDFGNPANNQLVVTNQWIYSRTVALTPVPSPTGRGVAGGRGEGAQLEGRSGGVRFDCVFVVNGLPIVIGEAKTPTRSAVTWFDGAFQVNEIYEKQVPAMFVPNVFSFATEGKNFRYGSIRMPIEKWCPWRTKEHPAVDGPISPLPVGEGSGVRGAATTPDEGTLESVRRVVASMLQPGVVLDILQNFTVFATDKKHRRIKIIGRWQQYFTVNQLVDRVIKGHPKKGLIWHFQGSGKSLLMVFAAQKLRLHAQLGNPTVIIVVDRIDLDTQITSTFNAADVPNMVGVESREELQALLKQDVRKVLITTIHKFGGSQLQPPSPPAPLPEGEGSNYRGGYQFSGLVERARELRTKQTPVEDAFWELVRNRQLADAKFRRQHQIGDWLVDFYCHEARLVVEFDGPVHEDRKEKDATRDKYLRSLGNTVLRFKNEQFVSDPQKVLEAIAAELPSPAGRGVGGEGRQGGAWCERSNIIVMVDEAHRTQEGDLGRRMREALPHAFLFGLTGTPINRADRNTYWAFGANEDEKGYMSRYSFSESIRDKATLPLHFEAPEVKLKIDRAAIDEAFKQITGELSEQDRDDLAKRAAKMSVLVKNPERIRAVVNHIVTHFQSKVEPNGFKAQVVVFDRECCILYKAVMDELIGPEASAIVISGAQNDPPEWKQHVRDKDAEENLLDRFRDPADPLKYVIVTSKLLTGFDAPILQVMYLDKPMKDHNLLQAICRTNRTFGQEKTHGLIVDYIGIFDDVARALDFDEKAVQQVVSNIEELRKALPVQVQKCLAFFPHVDRSVGGYEGLLAAQQCLPTNEVRDKFASHYIVLGTIWEALSPDPCLSPYEKDYRWLTQVYESVKPPSGNGKLLWHALGAKTVELINQNVHLESVRDDVETLVLDAQVLEDILKDADPAKRGREIEIRLIARLRKHFGNPKFTALGERLEKIKERHEQGFLNSLQFLKEILELAKEVLEAEKESDPQEERDRAKEALTDLFKDAKTKNTHIIVERIVADIDDIVKKVRFPDWQRTNAGERLVQKELRRTLLKYKLHTDQELFDKAYGYIRQYY
ncbi:MAG: DUF559 domain-containing protein [Verrucomicrobia bacterium]|jgi:type I site-specific restriction-modification system R (restriction) subunit|nr:DUF559 domain-containing protein [Verrucomicrobiota bacterium]